jgi:hypothetical protein
MVTWVLADEPDVLVAKAIEICESRVGSDQDVLWVSPGPVAFYPTTEPAQD